MTKWLRRAALGVMVIVALAGLAAAGCGSASSTSTQAQTAAAQASINVAKGCYGLQTFSSSDTAGNQTISLYLDGSQAGKDFSRMMHDISTGDTTGASAAATALSADCFKAVNLTLNLGVDVTDPNGKTCPALDSSGYCPGDSPSPSPSPSASPTMTRQTDLVVFKVSGSGYPSVQYGTDSNNNSPTGGYGPLGNGVALPWSTSLTYDSNALYYYVSAQLQGYGDISDSVTEVITTYCSNGHHKTESFPLASGHASGSYNIAQAEYASGATGNATQAESDAGC